MKNAILIVVGLLVLGYSGYRFFAMGQPAIPVRDRFETPGVCINCQEEVTIEFMRGEQPPYTCPACSEQNSVYLWWYCLECHRRFIPEMMPGDPPRPTPYPKCTGCGCQAVAVFEASDPDLSPVGDVPLKNSLPGGAKAARKPGAKPAKANPTP